MLDLCFDRTRHMFGLCLTNVSTFSTKFINNFECACAIIWLCWTYVLTLLDLFFDFARPIIRLSLTCVSTKLDVCFDLPDRNRVCVECARLKIGPCSTYVSPVLEPSFNSLHRNRVRLERARLMFQLFWPKVGLWQRFDQILVCSDFLGPLSACFDFLDQISICFSRPNFDRLSRLNKKTRFCSTQFRYVSTLSTKILSVWKFKILGF